MEVEVTLLVGYGTLVTGTELGKPLEGPVGFREKEVDAVLLVEMDVLTEEGLVIPVPVGPGREVKFQIPLLVGNIGIDEEPVPTGTVEVVFQRPVLLGYGAMDDDPVPASTVEVVFQRPVLLGYKIEDEPVPAVGPSVYVVVFQMPVLLGDDGRDAEADGTAMEDEVGEDVIAVADAVVEPATDEEVVDVELEVADVTGFFAQSQSVN